MYIKKIEKKYLDEYQVQAKKNGTIFNSIEWTNIYEKNSIYGLFNKDNKIIGGFNIYKQKFFGLNYYKNPIFSPTINLFYETKAKNKSKKLTETKKIITLIANFVNKLPYHIVSIYFQPQFIDMQPFCWNKYKVVPTYTYIIDLQQSIKVISQNMSPERRNDIKKAERDNIYCKKEDDYQIVKQLILNTFNRKQKKIDINFIEKILFQFSNSKNSFAYVSYQKQTPIATVYCIYDKQKVYYLLGGYDKNNRHHGAGALAVWEAIKFAKEKKIPYFDFEGSMLLEVEKYFRGFGGTLTPLFSVNKAKMLIEILLKFVKRNQF